MPDTAFVRTVNRRMDTWKTLEDFDLVSYEIELRGGEDGKWVSLQTLHDF